MRRIGLLILVGLISLSGTSLSQEIYRWLDESGVIHFADDLSLVPEKYRDQVQKKKVIERPSPQPDKPLKETEFQKTLEKEPRRKDLLGRGEEWWRAKGKEWEEKLLDAKKNYDLSSAALKAKQKELDDSKFKPDSLKRKLIAEIKKLEERVMEWDQKVKEAKEMLERVLPKEAEDYRADPSWLKGED